MVYRRWFIREGAEKGVHQAQRPDLDFISNGDLLPLVQE